VGWGACLQHAHTAVEHNVEGEERREGLPVQRKSPHRRDRRGALARRLRRLLQGAGKGGVTVGLERDEVVCRKEELGSHEYRQHTCSAGGCGS
jgi:hypothetical protein